MGMPWDAAGTAVAGSSSSPRGRLKMPPARPLLAVMPPHRHTSTRTSSADEVAPTLAYFRPVVFTYATIT